MVDPTSHEEVHYDDEYDSHSFLSQSRNQNDKCGYSSECDEGICADVFSNESNMVTYDEEI